jgi:LmbE family N-acetylglucosaminyl deacetylase
MLLSRSRAVKKRSRGPSSAGLSGRVVVVSPHLDDAVMSLGSAVAQAVQTGARVEILTVFSDVPSSKAPAGPWDSKCGFATEGEAATARREEDRSACSILGAEPRWLDFGDECYERRGNDDDIHSAVTSAVRGADAVLIPGFPLTHADHASLSELLLRKGINCPRIGLYAEQPYMFVQDKTPTGPAPPSPLKPVIGTTPPWTRLRTHRRCWRTKYAAVRSYRSQLRHLGLGSIGLHRMLWREATQGGEAMVWLP